MEVNPATDPSGSLNLIGVPELALLSRTRASAVADAGGEGIELLLLIGRSSIAKSSEEEPLWFLMTTEW